MDKANSGICKNCNNHIREKLVEILRKPIFPHELVDPIEAVADYLLDSGVTVQEWIPVSERLPEEDTIVLVWLAPKHYEYTNVDTDRFYRGRWVRWNGRVTHWTPVPPAPKGE